MSARAAPRQVCLERAARPLAKARRSERRVDLDPQIRELERRLSANPRDIEAGRRLAAIDRRTGKTFEGKSLEDWARGLASGDPLSQLESLGLFEKLGPRACEHTEAVLALLKSRRTPLRVAAIEALAAIAEPRAIPALSRALFSKDEEVRGAAARALGALEVRSLIPELIKTTTSKDSVRRAGAFLGLGALGGDEALAAISAALESSRGDARRPVIEAAGLLGHPSLAAPIQEALGHRAKTNEDGYCDQAYAAYARIQGSAALGALIKDLEGPLTGRRWAAARALGILGDAAAVPALLKAFKGAMVMAERFAILEALSAIGDPAAGPAFAAALNDWSPEIRFLALEAASKMPLPGARGALTRLVNEGLSSDRQHAVTALGLLGEAEALPTLLSALDDRGWTVQRAAIRALVRLGHPEGDAALIRRCGDAPRSWDVVVDDLVTERGARAEPLLTQLAQSGAASLRGAALEGLAAIQARGAAPLVDAAMSSDDADLRVIATRARSALSGRRGAEEILAAAADPNPKVRGEALRAIGEHRIAEGLPLLLAALDDAEVHRSEVVYSLAEIGGPEASAALLALVREDSLFKEGAILGLGRLGEPAALPLFEAALRREDRSLTRAVIVALKGFEPSLATPLLMRAARSEDWVNRCAALEDLGERGEDFCLPALLAALNDPERDARRAAAVAIGQVAARAGLAELAAAFKKRPPRIKRSHFRAVAEVEGGEAVLIAALERKQAPHARAAAQALGERGGDAAVGPLSALVRDRSASRGAHEAAVEALGKIGGAAARKALEEAAAMKIRYLKAAALRALKKLGKGG